MTENKLAMPKIFPPISFYLWDGMFMIPVICLNDSDSLYIWFNNVESNFEGKKKFVQLF